MLEKYTSRDVCQRFLRKSKSYLGLVLEIWAKIDWDLYQRREDNRKYPENFERVSEDVCKHPILLWTCTRSFHENSNLLGMCTR